MPESSVRRPPVWAMRVLAEVARWLVVALLFFGTGEIAVRGIDAVREGSIDAFFDEGDPQVRAGDAERDALPLHVRSSNPDMIYELRPHADVYIPRTETRVVTNAMGFRDRERSQRPPPGVQRVVALGDSVTFGWRIEPDEVWTAVAERSLRDRTTGGSCGVEVLNLGIGGYNTVQEAALLEEKGLALEPDLVLLAYVDNDDVWGADGGLMDHFSRWPWRFGYRLRRLASTSGLWPMEPRERPDELGIAHLRDLLEGSGTPLVVADFPTFVDGHLAAGGHRVTPPSLIQPWFRLVDLTEAFEVAEPGTYDPTKVDVHPDEVGQRIAGLALAEVIVEELGLDCVVDPSPP